MARLTDIDRALALFAEGIAGRPYHVKALRELPAELGAPWQANGAAHDARSLYLPETLSPFADDRRNEGAYRVLALQQLGFREFGTYRFDMDAAARRIPALATWPRDDDPRTSHFAAFFAGFEQPAAARRLFHAIETARVRAAMEARYPGARRYQRTSAGAALHTALARIAPQGADLARLAAPVRAPGADVYTSAAATVACYEALGTALAAGEGSDAPTAPSLDMLQREARLGDWEDAVADFDTRAATMRFAAHAGALEAEDGAVDDGAPREPDVDLATVTAQRDRLQRRLDMERASVRRALGDERVGKRSFRYDEWDHAGGVYLRGWCRLYEERLAGAEDGGDELLRGVAPHAKAVRRRFEQVRPAGYQRVKKTPDGDELDLDALVTARADIRAGVSPEERVYSRRERLRRDVAAAFLIDLSASTDDLVEPDEAPAAPAAAEDIRDPYFDDPDYDFAARMARDAAKRRVIDIEREAAVLMATALEGLGDRYAVYGFSGYGRDCVEFAIAKEFDEPFDARVAHAIAAMKPKRSTRMGPAVRHATGKLAATGAALRVLMIVSDGFPQDHDYGPRRGDHEYGLQDTAKALREAETRGVETFCVTVDRSGHDYLRRMCPPHRYMVITETSELPEALQVAYRHLTRI